MALKYLNAQQLEEWKKQNPTGTYYDETGNSISQGPKAQDLGAIGNLLRSISKPLRAVPGAAVEAFRNKSSMDNPFFTPEEERAYQIDPVKAGMKDIAGLGAFLVPGGGAGGTNVAGRIAVAAGKGAVSGGLGGYSASDDNNELESILKGVGLGGVLGGGLQAGGEAIGALKNVKVPGKAQKYLAKQRGEAIGLDPNKLAKGRGTNIKSATQGEEVIADYFSTMDDLGLPTRTSNIASQSSDEGLSLLGQQFDDILKTSDESIVFGAQNTKDILDRVTKEVGGNTQVMKASTVQELMGDLLNLGDNYTPSQLNLVREKARDMINFARSGVQPNTERGVSSIFSAIDDLFKESLPQSSDILGKMKNIYTVRPYIQGKAQLGDVIKVGTASTNIGVPTAGVNEAIQSTIGKIGSNIPTQTADVSAIQNLLGGAGKVAQRVAPPLAGQIMGSAQPQQTQVQTGSQMPQQNNETQALQYALADAIYSGQISAAEAEAIMGLLGMGGMGGGELSANQSKATALQTSLDKLRQTWEGTGSGGRLMETLGINIGSGTRSLDQAKIAVMEDLGRLQSQGVISPTERDEFERMMPNSWDSQQGVEQKLQAIQDRINAYL